MLLLAMVAGCSPRQSAPALLLPGLDETLAEFEGFELEQQDQRLVFSRRGDEWWIEGSEWPADRRLWQPLLLSLAQARCDEPRTADPVRFARIGLGWPALADGQATTAFHQPTARLHLEIRGQAQVLRIGHPERQGGTFVLVEGAAHSCLTRSRLRLPATVGEWFDPRLHDWRSAAIQTIAIEDPGRPPQRLQRHEGHWQLAGQAPGPAAEALAQAIAHALQLQWQPRSATPDVDRRLRVTLDNGAEWVFALRREGVHTWVAVEAPAKPRYLDREFRLSPEAAEPLWGDPAAFGPEP